MKRLIIIGASGHGKVVSDIAAMNGYTDIVFLDDNNKTKECAGFPVIGGSLSAPDGEIFVAIGNETTRKYLMEYYSNRSFPVLIHPNAVVANKVEIGPGTVIMAGAVINPGAIIGMGSIINTCSSVDHDCIVSKYVHMAVGSHLCGSVTIGEGTWIGAGVIVSNNISICSGCTIGAGAVVVKDITLPGVYIGCPATLLEQRQGVS